MGATKNGKGGLRAQLDYKDGNDDASLDKRYCLGDWDEKLQVGKCVDLFRLRSLGMWAEPLLHFPELIDDYIAQLAGLEGDAGCVLDKGELAAVKQKIGVLPRDATAKTKAVRSAMKRAIREEEEEVAVDFATEVEMKAFAAVCKEWAKREARAELDE